MKAHRIIAIAAAAVLAVPTYSSATESEAPHRIVGYLPDWNYQPFNELDLNELTHINIAFCNPDESGRLFCYIPDDKLKSIVSEAHSHDVEVFAALGGGGGCEGYLQYVDTPEERAVFNSNIMKFCESYDFDGIWELTQDAKGEQSLLKVINDTLRSGTFVAGDVNADGSFNVSDLVLLQRWLLAKPDSELADWQAGDLCADGRLDVFDLCLMKKKARWIT